MGITIDDQQYTFDFAENGDIVYDTKNNPVLTREIAKALVNNDYIKSLFPEKEDGKIPTFRWGENGDYVYGGLTYSKPLVYGKNGKVMLPYGSYGMVDQAQRNAGKYIILQEGSVTDVATFLQEIEIQQTGGTVNTDMFDNAIGGFDPDKKINDLVGYSSEVFLKEISKSFSRGGVVYKPVESKFITQDNLLFGANPKESVDYHYIDKSWEWSEYGNDDELTFLKGILKDSKKYDNYTRQTPRGNIHTFGLTRSSQDGQGRYTIGADQLNVPEAVYNAFLAQGRVEEAKDNGKSTGKYNITLTPEELQQTLIANAIGTRAGMEDDTLKDFVAESIGTNEKGETWASSYDKWKTEIGNETKSYQDFIIEEKLSQSQRLDYILNTYDFTNEQRDAIKKRFEEKDQEFKTNGTMEQLTEWLSTLPEVKSVDMSTKTVELAANNVNVNGPTVTLGVAGFSEGLGQGTGEFSGNVNSLGHALADGNVKTKLANKTLVGELGPELAVYDGMYHLGGQHGAEFVDIPNDAIVFNHLQTEGIINGQWGFRGTALADGNVEGPARDNTQSGAGIWYWDMMNKAKSASSSSGSSGRKAAREISADLERWYNLTQLIADAEARINNLVAERELMIDGSDYVESLREQQALLQKQIQYQKELRDDKKVALQQLRKEIEGNQLLSHIYGFRENGQLQYLNGNDKVSEYNVRGGRITLGYGQLDKIQQFEQMTIEQQDAFLEKIGFTFTDTNGHQVTKKDDLAKKFVELVVNPSKEYSTLYDEILAAEGEIAKIDKDILGIDQEILDNQKELEKTIYDAIVDQMQQQIDTLEEQKNLIKEANDAYSKGLSDSLDKEKKLYDQSQNISDREGLQRQLALLKRSGGSATEIASLEQQIDDSLRNEYFDHQQQAIDDIKEANDKQVEDLEEQIQLQKDNLEWQKETGALWTKVYEIMSGSEEDILNFLRGNSKEWFSNSGLTDKALTEEWAKKIGIYVGDREYQANKAVAKASFSYDDLKIGGKDSALRDYLVGIDGNKNLTAEEKAARKEEIVDLYASLYASNMQDYSDSLSDSYIADEEQRKITARENAIREIQDQLGIGEPEEGSDSPIIKSSGSNYKYSDWEYDDEKHWKWVINTNTGKKEHKEYEGAHVWRTQGASTGNPYDVCATCGKKREVTPVKSLPQKDSSKKFASQTEAADYYYTEGLEKKTGIPIDKWLRQNGFSTGGETGNQEGLAYLHKKERVLSAEQTQAFDQLVDNLTPNNSLLQFARLYSSSAATNAAKFGTIEKQDNSINIAPGAITINASIGDEYDVNTLADDIMNEMYKIAAKSSSRGVTRR